MKLLSYFFVAALVWGQADIRLTEGGLRAQATATPLPQYPTMALAAKQQGPVVALIRASRDGMVAQTQILEAPSPALGQAVREALKGWRVPPSKNYPDLDSTGKVTMYFTIENGQGKVLHPNQMPGNEEAFVPPGKRLKVPAPKSIRTVPATDASVAKRAGTTTILDIGERGHADAPIKGSRHIPFDELYTRVRAEVPLSHAIVVTCASDGVKTCQSAGGMLVQLGYADVTVMVR